LRIQVAIDLVERALDLLRDPLRDLVGGDVLALELRIDRAALVAVRHRAEVREARGRHEHGRHREHVDPRATRSHPNKHSARVGGDGCNGTAPMSKALIVVPTYNERDNVAGIAERLLAALPSADLLFVDDNSPDGTGTLIDDMTRRQPRIHVMHRAGKLGLGT